jgi:hypothetical protein
MPRSIFLAVTDCRSEILRTAERPESIAKLVSDSDQADAAEQALPSALAAKQRPSVAVGDLRGGLRRQLS